MAFCCQLLLLPRTAASLYCCRHCCHCLSRGSSGRAGVAACSDSSGSSSSGSSGGSSGAILFLIVVVILLLFTSPLLVGIVLSPFRFSLLFPQAAACPLSTHNGWLLFAPKLKSKKLRWCSCARPIDLCHQRILTPAPPPPPPCIRHCPTASGCHHPLPPPLPLFLLLLPLFFLFLAA